jgi:hypothetical protein
MATVGAFFRWGRAPSFAVSRKASTQWRDSAPHTGIRRMPVLQWQDEMLKVILNSDSPAGQLICPTGRSFADTRWPGWADSPILAGGHACPATREPLHSCHVHNHA